MTVTDSREVQSVWGHVRMDGTTKRTICDGVKSGLVGWRRTRAILCWSTAGEGSQWLVVPLPAWPAQAFLWRTQPDERVQLLGWVVVVLSWGGVQQWSAVVWFVLVRACPCLFWKCSAAEICVTGGIVS